MMRQRLRALFLGLAPVLVAAPACSSLGSDLPEESPALTGMNEPPALFQEPTDEATRAALPLGGYTGIHVTDGRTSLGGVGSLPEGVLVQKVVENSPADAAGIRDDDLILAVRIGGDAQREIHWPSEWRDVELAAAPGTALTVLVDRAGVEDETIVTVAQRVRAPDREETARYREEQRVGVVVRSATEVEARAGGLGPGAGAVIVGMTEESPWRTAGLRFGDLIVAVGDRDDAHPQDLLDAIRDAPEDGTLALRVVRPANRFEIEVPLSHREQELRQFSIPPLFSYGSERGESELSILLGLIKRTSTQAAWSWRFLWFISIGAGDADRLEEVE